MSTKIQEWEKPKKHNPIINHISDISPTALSQLVQYLQQFPPSIPGRNVDGAASIDVSLNGVYQGTVSNIDFQDGPSSPAQVTISQPDGTASGVNNTGGSVSGAGGGGGSAGVVLGA